MRLAPRGWQVAMGRGDHAGVEAVGLAADGRHDALFDRAQNFALHRHRHVADLVEQQRAARGFAKGADAIRRGAGEGAFHMSEKLALQQICGDGCAIDRDEGLFLRTPCSMQGAGNELFAASGFAQDQHRRIAVGGETDGLLHAPHRFA